MTAHFDMRTEVNAGASVDHPYMHMTSSTLRRQTTLPLQPNQSRYTLSSQPTVRRLIKQFTLLLHAPEDPKISENATSKYFPSVFNLILQYRGSVIPAVAPRVFILVLWSTVWTCLYMLTSFKWWATAPSLASVLSFVVGLLLVFRTNTAYDRFWEGRKQWGTLTTQVRNLARVLTVSVSTKGDPQFEKERKGALNLALAFAFAVKHELRGATGYKFNDMAHLLVHVPLFHPRKKVPSSTDNTSTSPPSSLMTSSISVDIQHGITKEEIIPTPISSEPRPTLKDRQIIHHIPLEILALLSSYTQKLALTDQITWNAEVGLLTIFSTLTDTHASLSRIRNTPIPSAYTNHLKQVVDLYLVALPFQVVKDLEWWGIPFVAVAGFLLWGIEGIAGEIEDPFNYDLNDLHLRRSSDDDDAYEDSHDDSSHTDDSTTELPQPSTQPQQPIKPPLSTVQPQLPQPSQSKTPLIIGSVVGALLVLVVAAAGVYYFFYRRNSRRRLQSKSVQLANQDDHPSGPQFEASAQGTFEVINVPAPPNPTHQYDSSQRSQQHQLPSQRQHEQKEEEELPVYDDIVKEGHTLERGETTSLKKLFNFSASIESKDV
ncbi:hypothetical protein HDV05_003963 [Chytridiales sp. JEL 0842]|nr:hypothetical protein HDV05_003963 [Chytridiales sp. JEL 0842]